MRDVVLGDGLENVVWGVEQLAFHTVGELLGEVGEPGLVEKLGGHRDHGDHVAHGCEG